MRISVILLLLTLLVQLEAQDYSNTVYLPYYRLPVLKDSSFDLSSSDPEPFLGEGSRFQEYLLTGLASGRITQVNYFRLLPAKGGDIDVSGFHEPHMRYLQKLRLLYGVRLAVSVAGGASRFLPVVHDKELRDVFAANIVALANKWQLDAVDFDWEYPRNKKDTQAYIALIQAVRSGLRRGKEKPENYLVSVAISRQQSALSAELFEAVDRVNFMSYDFTPRHSTMEDAREMVDYLSARFAISPGKIFLGLPFYGRKIKTGRHGKARTYERLAQEFDPAPGDDEVENYYFNGQEMIREKFLLAQERGLGGTMIWEIAQDSKDQRSLLKVLPRQK